MTSHHLLILAKDAHDYHRRIQAAQPDLLDITVCTRFDQAKPVLDQCDLLFAVPDLAARAIPKMPRLKWLQSMWAGVTPLMAPGLPRSYCLTGVKGIFGPAMGEYLLCHMLMHQQRSLERFRHQQAQAWDQTTPGSLKGKTLGIMGLGSIGLDVAATAKSVGMTVHGLARRPRPHPMVDQCFSPEEMSAFLGQLDYLVSILPHTPETDNLINADVFKALPPSAVFINVGRGNAVDETALVTSLEKGEIAAAVLDVFKTEPLPPGHPLWTAPNIVLTSHTAAMSSPDLVCPIFIENYRRWIHGKGLLHRIDFNTGY